jgi:hypothetical protein
LAIGAQDAILPHRHDKKKDLQDGDARLEGLCAASRPYFGIVTVAWLDVQISVVP